MQLICSDAFQDFPEGVANSRGIKPKYLLQVFCRKLQENENIWTETEPRTLVSLYLPLIWHMYYDHPPVSRVVTRLLAITVSLLNVNKKIVYYHCAVHNVFWLDRGCHMVNFY